MNQLRSTPAFSPSAKESAQECVMTDLDESNNSTRTNKSRKSRSRKQKSSTRQSSARSSSLSSSSSSSREQAQSSKKNQHEEKRRKRQSSTKPRCSTHRRTRGVPLNFDRTSNDCTSLASTLSSSQRSFSSSASACTMRSSVSCPASRSEMRSIIHSIRQQRTTIEEGSDTTGTSGSKKLSTVEFEQQKAQILAKWEAMNTQRKEKGVKRTRRCGASRIVTARPA